MNGACTLTITCAGYIIVVKCRWHNMWMAQLFSNDKTHQRFENDSHSEMTNSLQTMSFFIYVHSRIESTLGYTH